MSRRVPKCKECGHWFFGENVNTLGKQYHFCLHPERANMTKLHKQEVITSPMDCPIRKYIKGLKNQQQ